MKEEKPNRYIEIEITEKIISELNSIMNNIDYLYKEIKIMDASNFVVIANKTNHFNHSIEDETAIKKIKEVEEDRLRKIIDEEEKKLDKYILIFDTRNKEIK